MSDTGKGFWRMLDQLVATGNLVVDRPQGTSHPRYPAHVLPLDYGYIEATGGSDGAALDVWIGSLGNHKPVGVICTVDLDKRDAELNLLLGCTPEEAQVALAEHNIPGQSGLLIPRSKVAEDETYMAAATTAS